MAHTALQTRTVATKDHMGSYDQYNSTAMTDIKNGEGNQKNFAYLVLGGSKFIYASAARLAVLKLLDTMNATADVLALASLEARPCF